MPLVETGATVLGLYSHIAHLVDKEEGEIPHLFKGTKLKQTRETPLVMHTYSTMILITKTYLHSETNTLHYYNKNYKTHIGIYMTQ